MSRGGARRVAAGLALAAVLLVPAAALARAAGYAPPSASRDALLYDGPLSVVANFEDSLPPHVRVDVAVKHVLPGRGGSGPILEVSELATDLILPGAASWDSAVAALRRTTGPRGRYFFVRTECGGGNAWKCASESVFMLHDGGLVALGTLATWPEGGVGSSWTGHGFRDYDADLEINGATSHAGAPGFEIELRERDGRLVGDTGATWRALRKRWRRNELDAKTHAKSPGENGTWDSVIAPRLANAAIARWCGRVPEASRIEAEAQTVLPAERFGAFEAALSRIVPGALPTSSAPARIEAHPLTIRSSGSGPRGPTRL